MNENKRYNSNYFEEMFEDLNTYINSNEDNKIELVKAKQNYFKITGKINDEDTDFSNRMNAFLLWFMFDWKLSSTKQSLFDGYLESLKIEDKDNKYKSMSVQKDHLHTLFSFIKIKNDKVIIKDIFNSVKYTIDDDNYLFGINKKTIFESRLFNINNIQYLSNYLIIHPNETKKDILKAINNIRKKGLSKKDFLIKLHSFHTKWKRYRNINIKSIYHFDMSIPAAK